MVELVWLIPGLPLAGFLLLVAFGKKLGEPAAGWLAVGSMGGSFAVTVVVWAGLRGEHGHQFGQTLFRWIPAGGFNVDMGFLVDPLSITMALFITGVASLIFVYAVGYMHGDASFAKFFVYLCLFAFSMLMLVLGSSLLVTFLGWEGVGACSYWLISFWFGKDANASAGKKAFVANRVGDWGFMVAMFLAFFALGSLDYTRLASGASGLATSTATAIAVLLFIGACGKSAQLPLYIWLPDAMAGPTPVSAMLHAATMVTAGVFLMVRMNPMLSAASPWVLTLIAFVGAITALFAATVAMAQNDIKKVLAYSTVSQLGYMFLAIGSGAYVAAIFHMVTHAFFKALLFLGAGSVIHGLHEEQDMRRMGALGRVMKITCYTFIVGWLAIAGIFPFSGFWSKDEILAYAFQRGGVIGPLLWGIGVVTALLTAYYMSREVFLVFAGKARWDDPVPGPADLIAAHDAQRAGTTSPDPDTGVTTPEEQIPQTGDGGHHATPHESPWTMTTPLVVLSGLAAVGGLLNLPFGSRFEVLGNWLEPVVAGSQRGLTLPGATQFVLSGITLVLCLGGIVVARAVYLGHRVPATKVEPGVLAKGWYFDIGVTGFMGGPGRRLFDAVTWVFDRKVIDGAVNGVASLVRGTGDQLRKVQTGYVRNYALGVALGAVVLAGYFVTRAGF